MTVQLSLQPEPRSVVLPGDRWRPVYTWKPPHVERLRAHSASDDPLHLALVREPDNEADPNAILVYDKMGPLGYLHGSIAHWLAKPLDRMKAPVIVEGRIWRGPAAYVGIAGRTTVLAFLREAAVSEGAT